MPDSVLDAIPDVAGLRAVRAKVHAEASPVCQNCGRHHLLDSRCSDATVVVDEVDDPWRGDDRGERADAHDDWLHDATTPTRRDESDRALRARRLVGSVIAYLGLDPASFGTVDDDVPATGTGSDAPPALGPRPPRVRRIVAFLGIDVEEDDGVTATELTEVPIAMSPIATSPITMSPIASDEDEADDNDEAEDEIAPVDAIGTTETPVVVDAEPPVVAVSDDMTRHYWRRTDDDILYRPSRRSGSLRRAWRDRVASRA